MNQFRTFSRPFEALTAGDEIDIPRDNGVTDGLADTSASGWLNEQNTAQASSEMAGALKSGDPARMAADKLRAYATDQSTRQIQDWLKGYGTARVRLGVDDKGRPEGSEIDVLLPLHDVRNLMTFTQMGLRHIDKHTTANLGAGQRLFLGEQMVGYNAFIDHDMTGRHSRAGIGAEYWRDYLKLGANSYFRLSGWKDARHLDGYDARPANGFDLRSEAYLPAYPQLGGKLMYEQYYGDEVGLFGRDKRQKNPGAVTAGVNYTPFPLLTAGIDRRQGTGSGGETRFNIGVRYEIGTPWEKQTDTRAVDALRSLAGSRYDLVERNNQIVLEYRRQETIRLSTVPVITGQAGEIWSLGVSVTSKNGLREIQWDAPGLLANGGQITETAPGQYSVTLPAWQNPGQNDYTVTGRAVDNSGNMSPPSSTRVTVRASVVSTDNSDFTASPDRLPADGQSASVLTLTVKDAAGNPVPGLSDRITLNATGNSDVQLSGVTEVSPGVYQSTLTAGTTAGTTVVTPVVNGTTLNPVNVVIGSAQSPVVSDLKLQGELSVGKALSAQYVFDANGGDVTDTSLYAWGDKGGTAGAVSSGQAVTTPGQVPDYPLTTADTGKVKEVSVQAKNGLGVTGNT
ncbi:inverse autotransporter beta domain-containing protein, partial [Morganella sp. EGD-HP17]|uniref:inverse autotransporter beta domain-containing protein n=1 Tax=Morganella sp. EGD-HP17 TaxID=1435146 RepID=UPI00044A7682